MLVHRSVEIPHVFLVYGRYVSSRISILVTVVFDQAEKA